MAFKKKLAWTLGLGLTVTGVSLGIAFATYLVLNKENDSFYVNLPISNNGQNIHIENESDNYDVYEEDFLKIKLDEKYLLNEQTKNLISSLNKDPNNWLKEEYFSYEQDKNIIVYTDPINGLKFKDHSYGEFDNSNKQQKEKRFLLEEYGLALLANHFYAKMTFGPEIAHLNEINVNDLRFTDINANGLYITNIENIYLNGSFVAEKGFTIDQKVKYLMPILFHEYMHHWVNSYVTNLDFNNSFIKATYRTDENPIGTYGYYYKEFYDNFAYLLHFQDKEENLNISNEINFNQKSDNVYFVGNIFNTKNLFELGNTNDNERYQYLLDALKDIAEYHPEKKVTFKRNNINNRFINSEYYPSILPYYYSIVELIPREWLKFAFTPYYSASDYNNVNFNNLTQANKKYQTIQNYWLTGYKENNSNSIIYTNNSYVLDWARTVNNGIYLSNSNSRNNRFNNRNSNIQNFENNVWPYQLTQRQNGEIVNQTPVYKLFYKLFLDSMGFNKKIVQIRSKINAQVNQIHDIKIDTSANTINQISLSGYLNSLDYNAIVLEQNNQQTIVPIKYTPFMRFNAFNKVINNENYKEIDILKPSDIYENLNNYVAYTSEYFDSSKLTKANISFWKDANKNGIIDTGELESNFKENPLSERPLITSNAKEFYLNLHNFAWKTIIPIFNNINEQYTLQLNNIFYNIKEKNEL
ncbi:hypothetical protein VBM87_01270 [Mycoplasma sp. 744]|uniref:MYPU_1760 family metalloprotease n=1 Tax=Mycoplasma sp. 744 TaxID=3108531 RepID=UPI002B1D6A97|nr:hypothetical protein [Mycoplasma sp. 744]MEA4115411.1 hypothetical protein [Mycoplasma sp. 744]